MKERMQRERSTMIWRRINRGTRPSRGRACREVQRSIGNRVQTFTTKESIERNIQLECASRFQLGYSAPIASTLLGDELQYLHDIGLAYSILMGTYTIPPHLDFPTQLILREIAKLGKSILMGISPVDITITGADYIRYWQKIKDRTSSSPSGVHITHYKASALNSTAADHFALQMNLIIRSGVHPLRWGSALQVMLEKVAGICLVDKLRSIQLYEADLNWFMKFIFNDIALTKLKETGLLPEEHYSNKGSTSEDACFEKTLTFDISRQSRTPMATISVNAAQCYDRVHPALMSLVWLALTNHPHSVILLLHVLPHMKIYTRTGFGDSSTYFGGPDETPLCGLGQGSKAAPAEWLQLSSMIVNAYKEQGCASTVKDPITGELTESIGCMFVDDTDLYCMSPLLLTAVLVVAQAQRCVSMWSNLLNATGGAIKGSKSFWYLIDYECHRGNWSYTQFNDSTHNLLLDQPGGNSSQLERKAPNDAIKTLGVFHSPAGDHNHHLRHLQRRSSEWLNNIRNGHLPSSYVLLSYHQQLWPGLRYGLGTLSNSLLSAKDCLCKFDYHLLPYIGVNRNIKREWRTLHSAFGGLGLFSLPIEQLICRTTILLQHYNTSSIIGGKLTCSIHLLQLQIGTNSNPLQLSYKQFGHLAPPSWLHSLWESINKYPIELHLTYKTIPFPRQYDKNTIMAFLLPHMPTAPILTSINRCRCNLNLLFLSDMTVADGTSIDSELICINATPRISSYAFPPERPTRDDWLTWVDVWTRALGRHLLLPQALGDWIHPSHIHWRWYYDWSTDCVFEDSDGHLHLFANDHSRPSITRSGAIYTLTSTDSHTLDGDLLPATCTILPPFRTSKHRISLRSVGPSLSIPNKLPSTFWDILEEFGGTWMWQTMHLDLDASVDWFLAALSHDSLVWVTDGSYNPLAAPDISGAGWIVKDCTTNRQWACSFYEVSENANSYRAELLGLYSIHVFVHALSRYFELLDTTTIKLRCDNKGALRTSSRRHKRIRPSSKCADILRCLRTVHENLRVHIHYAYVASHMDDILQWHKLSIEQQLNVQCDTMAKSAVTQATRTIQSGTSHLNTSLLPLEQCAIFINKSKLPSDISHPLRFECSRLKAKNFLCTQRGWSTTQFDEVDWQSLDVALSSKTTGFRIWLAKQHSNFCATRVQLHRYKEADDDKCLSCLSASENADHLCRCPNEERTQLLRDSTAELELWMSHNNNTHHELCYWIPHYILCRGQVNFCNLGPMSPEMYNIAQSQDSIGRRNFMEGRISNKITSFQRSHLTLSGSKLSVKRWMSQFISKILHITHSQWIFRNFMLHDKALGFLRLKECTEAAIQIDSLMQSRPSSLPAESQFLLEFDTEKLLAADSDTQQYWIAAMDAALAAKHNIQQPQQTPPPRRLHSRWKASHTIAQSRSDINQQSIPLSWITSHTAVSGIGPTKKPRPSPHVIQLSLPSNKKRKPD